MFDFWRARKLEDVINATLKIKVCGIIFRIKKMDAINFMDGSSAVMQIFQSYEDKRENKKVKSEEEKSRELERVRKHYTDVFLAAVVEPKLCRKLEDQTPGVIFVDHLFTDWALVNELYSRIIEYTWGKKKV